MRTFRCIACVGVLISWATGSVAASSFLDSSGVGSTAIVRSQLQSIAGEIVDSAHIDAAERVAVLAEGEGPRTLAENAVIEALQKHTCSSIVMDTASVQQILHIVVFESDIKLRELHTGLSERSIRTALEARVVKGAQRQVSLLGVFSRETRDTAQVFASGVPADTRKSDDGGILQRMLTPFIIIGGAIVIVYLFFTVRS